MKCALFFPLKYQEKIYLLFWRHDFHEFVSGWLDSIKVCSHLPSFSPFNGPFFWVVL